MKIIIGGRQTGKTTQLIKEAAEVDGFIVAWSRERAAQIFNMAEDLGIHIRNPISLHDLMRCRLAGSYITTLYIDDAERMLSQIMYESTGGRGHVEAITVNLAELDRTMIMTDDGRLTEPKGGNK